MELEIHRKDGSTLWMEAQMSFLLDGLGKPTGILGVSRDIGERKRAEDSRQKAIAYEYESQRARELDILLKASEATSSSLDFDTVMHTLASQLIEISGFECCFISEWNKDTNSVIGRLDHSKIFWREDLRDSYSMSDYSSSNQVLLTGNPIILQGNFEAEEKKWMEELKRTAIIILALFSREKVIGLVEIESLENNKIFDPSVLEDCQKILSDAASWVLEPLPANEPKKLFEVGEALLQVTGASICSFSEWDKPRDCVLTTAVFSNTSWEEGQGPRFNPNLEIWKDALYQGKTSVFENSNGDIKLSSVVDNSLPMTAESLIVFPLLKGDERIGVIELYNFNHKTYVTPEQITLLRTIADKASYSIENARLLQLTQKKLDEQIILFNEKEVLLKEIHHRVKNNLQIISSLLNLQSSRVTDPGTIQSLRDSQSRVRSMALIHEKLYQSQSLAKIDFGEYVKSLAGDLFRSYRQSLTGIELNIQTDKVLLELDQAVPCGLILNELITNALKYAFPDGRNGTITVELRAGSEQNINLRVADNGIGMPLDFDILKANSLGLQLINSLVSQLDGRLELGNSQGTDFLVSFPY
jgi:two-component sensor histidine kinase